MTNFDFIFIHCRKFEEEQAMLRRRVEANEIKIAELRASNEYLMAQNAQLRLNTVQVSRVVSTVTNTTPQQAAVQAQPTVNKIMPFLELCNIRIFFFR